ncbi:MAG: DEAD/DEAH box helicase [Fimbriimonas sp.]|nr:DEAD/DEAH box helicase [Fimbriimonas sp.]
MSLENRPEVSFDVCIFPYPQIRGKIFRIAERIQSQPPDVRKPALPGIEGSGSGDRNKVERRLSIEFLYDLLYPAVDEDVTLIPGFADLHAYQRDGVKFLVDRNEALLADDMGLGKTAQCAIAIAILRKQERLRRALVICPRSVIQQWKAEAKRWGGLTATIVEGAVHKRTLKWRHESGLLLTTPHLALKDEELLKQEHFDLVVCDDIAMLKNPGQITTAIREIPTDRSWCLNGTPLENRPEDLLNTMEFVCPGLFTYSERLQAPSKTVIDERIKPYFLRRRKEDHLDLPAKVPIGPLEIELEGEQLRAYREAEQREWAALQESGINTSRMHIFGVIAALIRLCNYHPPSGKCAKLDRLADDLETVLSDPTNKAVVFSHDVKALEFLVRKLHSYEPVLYFGGLTSTQRATALSDFAGSKRLLLGSVKACGRGLNLQHASYVFHFDRTWNPVDELQAEDRCWRQGQTKTVFVTRFLVKDTIEERIDKVLKRKSGMFDEYINDIAVGPEESDALASQKWSLEDFMEVLKPQGAT